MLVINWSGKVRLWAYKVTVNRRTALSAKLFSKIDLSLDRDSKKFTATVSYALLDNSLLVHYDGSKTLLFACYDWPQENN